MTRITTTLVPFLISLLLFAGCGEEDAGESEPNNSEKTGKSESGSPWFGGLVEKSSEKSKSAARKSPVKPVAKKNAGANDSPGRRLTEWVLKKGGYVAAYIGEKSHSWKKPVELPPGKIEPFLIKLEGAVIADEEMKLFAGQPRLRSLHLDRSTVTDDGLKHLKNLPKLEGLMLNSTRVTDIGMKHLAQIPNLQGLYVASTQVGDAGLKEISKLPSIRYLWIINANVTDAGLVHVGKMKALYTLVIGGNNITDKGIEHLKGLRSLNTCDLRNTKVTPAAGKALDEALPNCQVSYDRTE